MNFKFLPFVIGMALASTVANAADGNFYNLTVTNYANIASCKLSNIEVTNSANIASCKLSNIEVTNSATFRNNLSANKLNVDGIEGMTISIPTGAGSDYRNFITGKNNKNKYTLFYVSGTGNIGATGLTIKSDHGLTTNTGSALSIYHDESTSVISAIGYRGVADPMKFLASKFTFDRGEVVINNKLTCKDELEVIGLTASTIKADDINVNMNNAADYVFDENYNLKSLSEVESYVNEHKHLPGIPSAAEMEQNGVSVSAMSNMLLEKVEELTLHMIRLEKENEALKAEVESLKK